ncbi:hypothetical protein [Neobacillus thermocopriae]|uniref:hypothetical protein n=1 Tax=Neobacillus thermocopriae TaxID=1215031 RepID=UPI00376FF199
MEFLDLKENFIPKKVSFIHEMMVNRFRAIAINKFDPRISHLLKDPYIPDFSEIYGIYCVYSKSILGLLNNKYSSFDSYEFNTDQQKEKKILSEEFEDVLDISTIVVISSIDGVYISNYYIGGSAERLNSILNLCLGFPKQTEAKYYKNTISLFIKDISIVEKMGYLDNILNEKV